tara:strand:+ start:420 stop:1097 length:678 start_codon:yes stop_codon:yes gene_type:complete
MTNLKHYYINDDMFEIGIDESGRGPLFGRIYTGAVVLPKDESFDHSLMCDSKKIKSFKKLEKISEYIKNNAISWSVNYESNETIDKINIRQSVLKCMQSSAICVLKKLDISNANILVDGIDFKPLTHYYNNELVPCKHYCIKSGDNTYTSIAAASILAKYERDKYILELCDNYPILDEYYSLRSNKGYGTKKHLDGINNYGITEWHRKSYGICKDKKTLTFENLY